MFKPGDKVVCVDPMSILQEDKIYTIDQILKTGSENNPFLVLKELPEMKWWSSRFSLAPKKEEEDKEKTTSTQESIEFLFERFKEYFGEKFKQFIKKEELADVLLDNFKEFLKEKNRRYGDSALNPLNIFSKEPADNELCNRLDDKLSRIKVSKELRKNDVADVFGYIALLLISKGWTSFEDLLD